MSLASDLNDKLDAAKGEFDAFNAKVDAFIASDAANFQALKDALAAAGANDPAIQAAIDKAEALRADFAATGDKVTAADAADNL
jgi:ABC-type transporter Mla subunit MlaD